jgi:hypothetical protein
MHCEFPESMGRLHSPCFERERRTGLGQEQTAVLRFYGFGGLNDDALSGVDWIFLTCWCCSPRADHRTLRLHHKLVLRRVARCPRIATLVIATMFVAYQPRIQQGVTGGLRSRTGTNVAALNPQVRALAASSMLYA